MKKYQYYLTLLIIIAISFSANAYAARSIYCPENNHLKIDKYFQTHYVNQPTVTIFIDQPNPGSRYTVDLDDIHNFGHSFVRIQYYDTDASGKYLKENVIYRGFYPTIQLTMQDIIKNVEVDSFFGNEDVPFGPENDHIWNIAKVYPVSNNNAINAVNFIKNYQQANYKFHIQNNNCTTFAVNVLKAANIKPEIYKHLISFTPEQEFLARLNGFNDVSNPTVLNTEYYSGADAAEDLRLTNFFLTYSPTGVVENKRITINKRITADYKYILKNPSVLSKTTKIMLASYMNKNQLRIVPGQYLINSKMSFKEVSKVFQFQKNS